LFLDWGSRPQRHHGLEKKPKASASSPASFSGLSCLTQPNRASENSQKRPSRVSSYQRFYAIARYSATQLAIVTEWASGRDRNI